MPKRDKQGTELAREARAMALFNYGKEHGIDNLKVEKAITENWSMARFKEVVFAEVMQQREIERLVAARKGYRPHKS